MDISPDCQNSNSTQVGFGMKMTLHTTTTQHHYANSMSALSQLLLTRFGPNFKVSLTCVNCHGDIFVQATFVHLTISAITQLNQFWPNYWTQFLGGQQFLDQHFVRPKMLLVICHALLGTLDMSILVFEYLLVNLDFSIFTLHTVLLANVNN